MGSRYSVLSTDDTFFYSDGCPVALECCQLLLDKATNQVLVQLKMRNIFDEEVIAVVIDVLCFSDPGEQLSSVLGFAYIGLCVKPGHYFGGGTGVPLPDNVTRRIQVRVSKAVCANGAIWENIAQQMPQQMPARRELSMLRQELSNQFKKDYITTSGIVVSRVYCPEFYQYYWFCACGSPNDADRNTCWHCGISASWLKQHVDQRYLEEAVFAQQKQKEALERQELLREVTEGAKKATVRKSLKIAIPALLWVLSIFAIAAMYLPSLKYSVAKGLYHSGKYAFAQEAFAGIPDYEDSVEYQNECLLEMALATLSNGRDGEAIQSLQVLVSSSRTTERSLMCRYRSAIELLKWEEYDTARNAFLELGEYEESQYYAKESDYRKAVQFIESNRFSEAIQILEPIRDFSNSADLLRKAHYSYAIGLCEAGRFKNAIDEFSRLDTFENSAELLLEAQYKYAIEQMEHESYAASILLFEKLGEYADTKQLLQECRYRHAIGLYNTEHTSNLAAASELFQKLSNYKNSAQYYNNTLYKLTLQIGESFSVRFRRQIYSDYAGGIVIDKITMQRISEDTVRFVLEFNAHTRAETIMLSACKGDASHHLFHGEKLIRQNAVDIYFDVPIQKVLNSTFIWARYFVGSSNLEKYRTDIDFENLGEMKKVLLNFSVLYMPIQ